MRSVALWHASSSSSDAAMACHALATRISRTRYAQRPERDSTAGERNESNAMHRRHRARQAYEIATTCTFQSTCNRDCKLNATECGAMPSAHSWKPQLTFASACALALRFTCATTYSSRVFGGVHMSIHKYACAHSVRNLLLLLM